MRVYACALTLSEAPSDDSCMSNTTLCETNATPALAPPPPHPSSLSLALSLSPRLCTRAHAHARTHARILLPTKDFFNPNDYVNQPSVLRSVDYGARNRLASKAHSATIVQCSTILTFTCTCQLTLRQSIVQYCTVQYSTAITITQGIACTSFLRIHTWCVRPDTCAHYPVRVC